ncbi:MAG: hypothetical protein ABI607_07310 [Betaproteobacteria bacterium]
MTATEAFAQLWIGFASDSLTGVHRLGTEDTEAPHVAPLHDASLLHHAEALEERERFVARLLPDFADDPRRPVVETLPYWCGCLSTSALIGYSHENHAETFFAAIALVLHSRIIRAAGSDGPGRPASPALELRFEQVNSDCGGAVQEVLRKLQSNYRALYSAGNQGGAAPGTPTAQRRTVIVHGTWAAGFDWWRDPGATTPKPDNLWNFLKTNLATGPAAGLVGAPDEFSWSGGNSDFDRRQGASDFLNWWRTIAEPEELDVVSHSHGGNVVMLALAANPALRLRRFVLLGTPARFDCVPRTKQVDELHNVYSAHDWIQVPGSYGAQRGEGRTQSDHCAATNLHVPYSSPQVSGVAAVGHGDLHHPVVWTNHQLLKLLA